MDIHMVYDLPGLRVAVATATLDNPPLVQA